jgi:hypothetical protein
MELNMQLSFHGFSGAKRKMLTEAAEFFAAQLMDPRMVRNLVIDIERTPKNDVQGECIDEEGTRSPRWFTINLRDGKEDESLVQILAHEMVHVKQHAKNELQSGVMTATRGGLKMTSRWMGKIWKPKGKEDAYWDAPWEIEAYGREVGLYQKWMKHVGK